MRLLLPLALFAKSLRRTTGYLASPPRMLRERWRWVIPAAWALMSYLIVHYTSSHAVEKRRESLASMCDERALVLQYEINATMNKLQALAILVSTLYHPKNLSFAIDLMTFERYAESTVFEPPLTSGIAFNHTEREQFDRQQGWSIKKTYSSKTKKRLQGPRNALDAEVQEPAEEYAPVIFVQDTYNHVIFFRLLSGADDRDNVLQARESGKGVLTAPCKLHNKRIGVTLTFAVYKYVLPPNARPQERIEAAIGYLGARLDTEALVDKLLHQFTGKQSIMVNVYDTTYEKPLSMYGQYGSNDTGSGMCHVSTLNFGDPSRKHEMHCRFIQSPPWPWMAMTSPLGTLVIALLIAMAIMSLVGNLVIALLIAKRIARVQDEMIVLKMHAEDADIGKSQVISSTVELEQDEIVDHVEEKLDEAERKLEEVGIWSKLIFLIERSKLITMVNKKLTSASIHSFPSQFCYLNKKAVSFSLLGLMICILVIGAFDLPFNRSLGMRREDENMVVNKFGWSHGRSLMAVANSDMIGFDLRNMRGTNDNSGQQQHWYSHISSKYQEETTEMQNGTVKHHHKTMVGLWIALVSVTMLVLGIAVGCVLLWCNRGKRVQQNELELSGAIMGPRRFQLCELVDATSNFADENKLGQGGFGPVYKGYLRNQDCHVAIKVLSSQQQSEQGLREFKAEVKVMTQLRHRNIVNLVGWCECDSQQQLLLVYELMAQGSLDKHLYDPDEILTWQQRYKIVLGLGSALLYLHRDCEKRIVHGDIKPANVMLDVSYNAKLGDFGLARLVEHGEEPRTTQVVAGTPGYIDPEFIANRWPRAELDVYSFGVVLLEIACGKRPASRQPNRASSLLAWVIRLYDQGMILDAADQRLNGEFDQRQMERVLVTGLWCAHGDPIQRPSIEQAMDVLRSADAELPVLRAVHDEQHIRAMEEQAYGDLTVEDRPVHAVTTSAYFTSKDSAYLLAQE